MKKFVVGLAVLGTLPLMVNAADLTIVNNTNRDSTSIINGGACSTILGAHGITRAHSTNVVPSSVVTFACLANRSNCKADVYMTANCTGPVVATAYFDTKSGIKVVTLHDNSYTVTGGGFQVTIDGGPAAR